MGSMGSPDRQTTTATTMAYEAANKKFRDLERLRSKQDVVIQKIKKVLYKIKKVNFKLSTSAPENCEEYTITLRSLLMQASKLNEEEKNNLINTVQQLDALISLGGQQQPTPAHRKKPALNTAEPKRKRISSNTNESPRMSSSPAAPRKPSAHSSINVGDQVAAKVSPEDAENHNWIVVKVTAKDGDGNSFEVVDEEPDDDRETGGRPYTLPISCIIPFPNLRADANYTLDFPQGSHVLAVYPGTTALYKACVFGPVPKKIKFDDFLYLGFDGDGEEGVEGLPQKAVLCRNIVALPEGHRQ